MNQQTNKRYQLKILDQQLEHTNSLIYYQIHNID